MSEHFDIPVSPELFKMMHDAAPANDAEWMARMNFVIIGGDWSDINRKLEDKLVIGLDVEIERLLGGSND